MDESRRGRIYLIRVFSERLTAYVRIGKSMPELMTFSLYRTASILHCAKTYVIMKMERHLKFFIMKFRLDVSEVSVHYYQHRNHTENNLKCL